MKRLYFFRQIFQAQNVIEVVLRFLSLFNKVRIIDTTFKKHLSEQQNIFTHIYFLVKSMLPLGGIERGFIED